MKKEKVKKLIKLNWLMNADEKKYNGKHRWKAFLDSLEPEEEKINPEETECNYGS